MTKYYAAVTATLDALLLLNPMPTLDRDLVNVWLNGNGTAATPGIKNLVATLKTKIADLKRQKKTLKRAYRLGALGLVQRLANISPVSGARCNALDLLLANSTWTGAPMAGRDSLEFYSGGGAPPVNYLELKNYFDKLEDARKAAVEVITHLRGDTALNQTNPGELADALDRILNGPTAINSDLRDEMKDLIVAMKHHMAVKGQFGGGNGENSSYWPSSFIASSSSSSTPPPP